ncbi:MAG: hypothetical protein IJ165_13900 [Proteobacteria bacterium]|nr:hypothetical protein [Pseudomonadota bacterium]
MKKARIAILVCMLSGCFAVCGCGSSDVIIGNTGGSGGSGGGNQDKPCVGDACDTEDACTAESCPDGECVDGQCVPDCTGDSCGEPETCTFETCPDGDCVDGECVPREETCNAETCPNGKCIAGECVIPKCDAPDADNDGISDENEGRAENRDSDGDTVPDYLDDDSDGDTIPDRIEAGNEGCANTKPVDTDSDMIPDYLDDDSDDNGIPDSLEAGANPQSPIDTDGDTVPDYIDDDNDGDGIPDILEIYGEVVSGANLPEGKISADCDGDGQADDAGTAENPRDCDADGVPDYMTPDSDGDTLRDDYEGSRRVGPYLARYSTDSDSNGISDADECRGQMSDGYQISCADTDNDTVPDFLDLDNDGDSLSDVYEIGKGYDPNNSDSDGDGADDLIEIGAGTDPKDPNVNPQSEGNFVFKVPYKKKAEPEKQSLSFATSVQTVDIYFAVDTSGSMSGEINTLKSELPAMLEEMRCKDLGRNCADNNDCEGLNGGKAICSESGRCIVDPSEGDGCFADMWTGFGVWGNVNRFENWQSLDATPSNTTKELGNVKLNDQGMSENSIQVGACVSEGTKYCKNTSSIKCYQGSGRVGCVGFRQDAIKILIQAGDEANYDSSDWRVTDAKKTGDSLRKNNIRYIGLYGCSGSGSKKKCEARDKGQAQVACWAGSCAAGGNCAASCDSISSSEMSGLYLAEIADATIRSETIANVRKLAKGMNLHITSGVEDVDKGAAQLVKELKVNITDSEVQGRTCTKVSGISGDTFQSIEKLAPGTSVCFDVIPVDYQELFPPTNEPQVIKARIKVMGDGSTLNSGIAYFLVPPEIQEEHIN